MDDTTGMLADDVRRLMATHTGDHNCPAIASLALTGLDGTGWQ